MNKIAELKTALGAGARATKYHINFSVPSAIATTSKLEDAAVLCKAASFPAITLGMIEVFAQGRKLPLPGDTTFSNAWTLTFYTTEDHSLRRDMIAWLKSCDHFQNNEHSGQPTSVMGELSVTQLDSAGNETARYTFHNVFVSEVGELTVGGDQVDTLLEFDVTFAYSDWVVGSDSLNKPEEFTAPTLNDIAS